MATEVIFPVEVRQAPNNELYIRWQDSHESLYPSLFLRKSCRCAGCIDEWTGKPMLDQSRVPADVKPVQVEGVGRYGIKIDWSDGHNTGIYGFDYLRKICPCDQCKRRETR